jgi:hypothetical protein
MHVRRRDGRRDQLVAERPLGRLHASLVDVTIEPNLRECREGGVAVDVHGIGRILHHPATLAVTLDDDLPLPSPRILIFPCRI